MVKGFSLLIAICSSSGMEEGEGPSVCYLLLFREYIWSSFNMGNLYIIPELSLCCVTTASESQPLKGRTLKEDESTDDWVSELTEVFSLCIQTFGHPHQQHRN